VDFSNIVLVLRTNIAHIRPDPGNFFPARLIVSPGNTKGGSITVQLTSCLTGLDYSVLQIKTKIVSSHTDDSKPVKLGVNGTVILYSLVSKWLPRRVGVGLSYSCRVGFSTQKYVKLSIRYKIAKNMKGVNKF
jgi:hypothetical protein